VFLGIGTSLPSAPGYAGVYQVACIFALALFGVGESQASRIFRRSASLRAGYYHGTCRAGGSSAPGRPEIGARRARQDRLNDRPWQKAAARIVGAGLLGSLVTLARQY